MPVRVTSRRRFLAAAVPALLGACARPESRRPVPAGAPVAIAYWKSLSGPRHDAQVALVDRFNAAQARVRVTLEHAGEYGPAAEKLRVALASGTPPETMMLSTNADLPAFARLGALHPLDRYVQADAGLKAEPFYTGFEGDSRFGGGLYQVPFARSTPLFFVNQDLLRSRGLAEAAPPTWGALLDVSRQLMRAEGQGARGDMLEGATVQAAGKPGVAAYGIGNSWWEFQSLLWSFGGAFSDQRLAVQIDAAPSVEAVQFLADLVHKHQVAVATQRAQPEFTQGLRAFLLTSTANLTQVIGGAPFRVGVAPVPGRAGAPRAIPGGGAGISILAAAPPAKRDAGWDFLRHMTSSESTAFFAQATGYAPVRPAAMARPELKTWLEQFPQARLALDQVQYVRPTDAILAAPHADTRIQDAVYKVLFEGAAVPQACDALAAALRQSAAEVRR